MFEIRLNRHECGWLHINITIVLITILVIKTKVLIMEKFAQKKTKCIPLFQYPLIMVVLDFQTLEFCPTHTFVHYKFAPLIHLCMLNSVFCTQLTNKLSELSQQWCCKTEPQTVFVSTKQHKCQSQWPCSLRHGSLSCQCYVLSGRDLCNGPITCPEKSYQVWCV